MNLIPKLSSMVVENRIITHCDCNGTYIIVVKPKSALVAAFGQNRLADIMWSTEEPYDDDSALKRQRMKAKDPEVFAELKAIQTTAQKHGVPRENVLLVDCSTRVVTPDEVAASARDALNKEANFASIRGNSF